MMQAALSSRAWVRSAAATGSAAPRVLTPRRAAARQRSVRPVSAVGLPNSDYGWVLASLAFTAAVVQWKSLRVFAARQEYGVQYPQMYAEGADERSKTFNCIQRSHQNTLEFLPAVFALQMALGLAYPRAAAALGLAWSLGRVVYALGYSTGDPNKRFPGVAISLLVYEALLIATAVVGVRAALGL